MKARQFVGLFAVALLCAAAPGFAAFFVGGIKKKYI
jgi:hypothetical protein